MKKTILNIFLTVAITLITILLYNCIVNVSTPIHLNAEYRSQKYSTETYVFYSDGKFKKTVADWDGEVDTGSGVYVIDGDKVGLLFLSAPIGQSKEVTMQIGDNGSILKIGDTEYKAESNPMIGYLVLVSIGEMCLIGIVAFVNKKSS